MGHGAMRDYLLFNLKVKLLIRLCVYFMMLFSVQLDVTTRTGFVALSFTPCFNCYPVYVNSFALSPDGAGRGFLLINGVQVEGPKPFTYRLSANNPAKFLIQTIPIKGPDSTAQQLIRIKAQLIDPAGTKQDIYDFTSSFPNSYYLFAPYGITYAIFGAKTIDTAIATTAATYSFNDGNF